MGHNTKDFSVAENNTENEVRKILKIIGANSHGCNGYSDLGAYFQKLDKTSKIVPLLKEFMLSEPVRWCNFGDENWPASSDRLKNQFYFLTGDLIRSTLPIGPGIARSEGKFEYWLVIHQGCDLVSGRGNGNRYFRVAPCTKITESMKKTDPDTFRLFATACRLKKPQLFPLPSMADDPREILGYYADFTVPYFLQETDALSADVLASLSLDGWHFLAGAIQNNDTRANMEDEEAFRLRR